MKLSQPQNLEQLAKHLGLPWRGRGDAKIIGVAPLSRATTVDLSFLASPRHRKELPNCTAAAIILDQAEAAHWPGNALFSAHPYADYARAAALFEQLPGYPQGVHPKAHVEATARIDDGVSIAAGAYIGAGVHIGAGSLIGPGCVLEENTRIGAHCRLVANVTLCHQSIVGQRVLVHPGVVIGGDGFGQAWQGSHWVKVPQLGRVLIGDDCEIGANTTIDRGALDDTILEHDVRVDNLVQIAHNVRIGAHTAIAACVGIAGSAIIGRHCLIAGAAAINGHIHICDNVIVQGMSSITHSINEPGEYGSAVAAQDARTWRRNLARLRNLDKTLRNLTRRNKNKA